MRLRGTLVVCALLALPAVLPSPAAADVFGPLELASAGNGAGDLHQQAEGAIFPALSANGRYLVFVGSFGGVPGVWRRDLASGAVTQVAEGDATMPSISADGRYVSFTTSERLLAGDTNNSPDVYVRDMEAGEGEPEFILVSAVDGSEEAARYSFTFRAGLDPEEEQEEEAEFGAIAGARSAISADGRYVVFETTAASNLLGEAEATPTLEVFVRDLATDETRLVSAEYNAAAGRPANGEDRPVAPSGAEGQQPLGAIFPGGTTTPRFRQLRPEAAGAHPQQGIWAGASISADGSTVAWMGQSLERQTQLLPAEQSRAQPELAEPLWRRISEGPSAPIRRVSGGSDPLAPACATSGELESAASLLDPCAGPFEHYRELNQGLWGEKVKADFVPQLSADGMTVAFITGARELASGELQFQGAESTDDLYVVDMAGGLTRVQALRRVTTIGGGAVGSQEQIEKSSMVVDYSVAPDGSQVAFTTQRTQFPLSTPAYVSAPAATAGMIELFDADLANNTLTRVTHGFQGEGQRGEELPVAESPGVDPYEAGQGAYAPSFSADGNTLSFASTANNLVFGDGNGDPDAFVVHRIPPTFETVVQQISTPPQNPAVAPTWTLGARAVSRKNGQVVLDVVVPGSGALSARASSTVRLRTAARRAARARQRAKSTKLATVQVASAKATAHASAEGLVLLTLTLTSPYRPLASGVGLAASVSLTFTAAGHPALHLSVPARFVGPRKPKPRSKPRAARRPARKGAAR
jgi:Tol biopolymer transport system component